MDIAALEKGLGLAGDTIDALLARMPGKRQGHDVDPSVHATVVLAVELPAKGVGLFTTPLLRLVTVIARLRVEHRPVAERAGHRGAELIVGRGVVPLPPGDYLRQRDRPRHRHEQRDDQPGGARPR